CPPSERLLQALQDFKGQGGIESVFGGFDSHALPPINAYHLLTTFLDSRRQGTSPRTIDFYKGYLNLAIRVIGLGVTGQDIIRFLDSIHCSSGGKHAYYRALRAFYYWPYSPKSGYTLNTQNNHILMIGPPKVEKRILPSLSAKHVEYLIEITKSARDKAIIALFTESGLRLSELANIKSCDINWNNRLIRIIRKGNKEALAVFGERTENMLKEWFSEYYSNDGNIWGMNRWGITDMLKRLGAKIGLPCNPHTFRRTFACLLRKAGVDTMTIKDLADGSH
ncbi:tyrosine-type recombinase/integrase, partial [Chloroflexota bacterium]